MIRIDRHEEAVNAQSETSCQLLLPPFIPVPHVHVLQSDMTANAMDEKSRTGFTIIGEVIPTKLPPVKLSDPEWVQKADSFVHSYTEKADVSSLSPHVSQSMIDKLTENGIDTLFPVQQRLIPFLTRSLRVSSSIRAPDVCVSSPTGSGKTLSFVIPIIEYLKSFLASRLRAVVIVPVGELGAQIQGVFRQYTTGTSVRVFCSTGKTFLNKDMEKLSRLQFDVLIATPGRLHELVKSMPQLDFSRVQLMVLDEADRIDSSTADRNFLLEFEDVVNKNRKASCPCCCEDGECKSAVSFTTACSVMSYSSAQKALVKWLFSATMSTDVSDNLQLFCPKLFMASCGSAGQFALPDELKEVVIPIDIPRKPLVVWYLLQQLKYTGILCFSGNLQSTHRLALLIRRIPGVRSAEFSRGMTLKFRNEKLKEFKEGKVDIIICSDIMARGLDVENVQYVVNYDAPLNKTAYVHRIGRTARAGKSGTAITLTTGRDMKTFKQVWRQVHGKDKRMPEMKLFDSDLQPFMADYEAALTRLGKDVAREKFLVRNLANTVNKR